MYSTYLFDLDGTIYVGDTLLPGAAQTITALRKAGRRTIFLSNNPTKTRSQYATKLLRMGIPTPIDDIVTSSFVMVHWLLNERPQARLFVVGEEPFKQDLRGAGFQLSETPGEIDLVVASFDRTFAYQKLQIAFDAIRAGARLIATNPDRYCPLPEGGGQPDCAAVVAAIEACTAVTCEMYAGKPSPIMIKVITDMLQVPPEQCIVVGDRLETDIRMGIAAGMATALVLTGDATQEKLVASGLKPSLVLERIDGLLEQIGP
jgi:NagD protein